MANSSRQQILVWNQPQDLVAAWSMPLLVVHARVSRLLKRPAPKRTLLVDGSPGSGKTTFLNYASLQGLVCVDFDMIKAYNYWLMLDDPQYDSYTLSDFAHATGYWKLANRKEIEENHFPQCAAIAFHADVCSDYIAGDNSLSLLTERYCKELGSRYEDDWKNHFDYVLLSGTYALYKEFLFHRDHDPKVKRRHSGHKILTQFEKSVYISDILTHIFRNETHERSVSHGGVGGGTYTFSSIARVMVLDHSYTKVNWNQLLRWHKKTSED